MNPPWYNTFVFPVAIAIALVLAGALASMAIGWIPAPAFVQASPRRAWFVGTVLVAALAGLTATSVVRQDGNHSTSPGSGSPTSDAIRPTPRLLIESTLGVANVTAGDTRYESYVQVRPGDVVKAEVYVRNREVAHDLEGLRIKILAPDGSTPSPQLSSRVTCGECYGIDGAASVSANDPVHLDFIRGSVVWKDGSGRERRDTDALVTSPDGALWGQLIAKEPLDSLTVTALFRVVR